MDWTKRVSFQELTVIVGLTVSGRIDSTKIPSEEELERQIEQACTLLERLHETYSLSMVDELIKDFR